MALQLGPHVLSFCPKITTNGDGLILIYRDKQVFRKPAPVGFVEDTNGTITP